SRTEPLFIEERAGRILHLEKPIGEKHNEVAFRHRTRCRWVDGRGEDSHGRAARSLAVELFGRSAVASHVQRAGVPGVGETQFGPLHVGDTIKTGRKHRRAGLLQDYGERAVDVREQCPWVSREFRMLFYQPTDHPGDERGTYPVTHDIADQCARRFFAYRKNTTEVTAHVTGREVE